MEEQGPWQDYAQPERPPWKDYKSGDEQPQQIPQAFIERIRRGQELQDAVTQSGDSFDKRFNEAYGDPFEAAAARTRQSVAPGRRQESLVTRLPEMMTAALVHGVTIGPILAAKRLGEKTMAGEDILDSESIADATAVAGLGMFAGTHFSRVGPAGVQRIGELPKAEDFRTGADVLRSPAAGPERYVITDPLGAKKDGETLRVQIIRSEDGSIDAFITDHGVVKNAPAYRNVSPEEAIAQTFGDHPQGAQPDLSKVSNVSEEPRDVPERITSAAIKVGDHIFTGVLHSDAYEAASKALGREVENTGEGGFVTSTGRYVGRNEALKLAENAKQVPTRERTDEASHELLAEHIEQNLRDLWEERGIHPAEAVHDADNDAFLKADLTHPNPEPRDRSGIARVTGSPVAEGTPRTELAKTGEAHIDAVLDSELTNRNIDNPVINDSYDVPYSAGGSTPLEDPTVYIDRHFPRSMTIDGTTFDPADPFTVHENIEQHVMDLLTKGHKDKNYTGADYVKRIGQGDLETPSVDDLSNLLTEIRRKGKESSGLDEKTYNRLAQLNREIDRGSDTAIAEKNAILAKLPKDLPGPDIPDEGQIRQLRTEFGSLEKTATESPQEYVDGVARVLKRYIGDFTSGDDFARAVFRKAFDEAKKHGIDTRKLGNDVIDRFLRDLSPSDQAFMRAEFAKFTAPKLAGPEPMDPGTAYKVAHHEWAEKAEGAWYQAHGIDQAKAEEAYRPFIDQIEHENPANPPPNLYEKPYPHQDVRSAKNETGPVPKPTAEEIAHAKEIVARAMESGELRPAIGGAEQAMARAQRRVAADTRQAFQASTLPAHNADLESFKSEFPNARPLGVADTFEIPMKDGAGAIEVAHNFGVIKIRSAYVEPEFEGKGYGIQAYKDVVDWAMARGLRVQSSSSVKVGAVRVYEALARRGYDVERNPNASVSPEGNVRTSDANPAFEISSQFRGPAGADITRPESLPTLDEQPPPRAGGLVAAVKDAGAKLLDIGRDIQMLTTPMVRGTKEAMATAKDFVNAMRRNRWEWSRVDQDIAKRFTPEQRKRMWDAADEESVLRQEGRTSEHMGLATLEPEERAAVEDLQTRSQAAWAQARDLGMVEGDGLPAYTPRMVINVAEAGGDQRALPLNVIGQNLRTRTSQMLRREHMTAEETEAAAKAKLGEGAEIARDIRALPLATAKLEDAVAGRTLINAIEDAGRRTGDETVSVGSNPGKGWFTIDHPAFKKWQPDLEQNPITGKWTARTDDAGNVIFKQVPIYVRGDFEGPLRSVLTQPSGAAYGALMSLKGKTMGLIMNSPIIHNAVEWGRALPAMPGKVATFRVYFDGNRAKNNPVVMREAIDAGLVPIGKRFFNQDITSIMEEPNLAPGRSWTAQVLGFIPDLFDQAAGDAVKASIDKAGDFWHNTLLWDRVGDLQMGLYTNFRDSLMAKGVDRLTASRAAAHWANRYAGALPEEAMSANARKISNLLLFSRSFTMGNIGAMKDMLTGLPKDVMAQIERDGGMLDPKAMRSIAVRKAIAIVTLDMGLMYVGNSLLQNSMNVLTQDSTLDKEMRGYAERFKEELAAVKEHPLKLLQPLAVIQSLSATAENEPGKEDRIRAGYASDGTAIYGRNVIGKIGEEFSGYLSGEWLDMLRRKLGTIARPIWQIMANDKGFGRKVYDPNADTPAKYLGNMGAIAKHLAMSQLPEGQIGAFMDLVKGDGDPKVNALQAFGPIAGVTFSKGAPGGPAVGELYQAHAMHNYAVDAALPDIRKQIQRGDTVGAVERMTELGVPPGLQRFYIRTSIDPTTRLSGRTLRDFYLYATPEQRQRLENAPNR